MADFIWARMSDLHGILKDHRGTWAVDAPWVGLNRFTDAPVFQPLTSPSLCAAIDDLLGPGTWKPPRHWGGFLVKFPDRMPENWTLPVHAYWHVDFHFTYDPRTPFGLRVFNFMSAVTPRGGGTFVVSGSHRLVERFVSSLTPGERQAGFAVLRERFNLSHPWLARLTGAESDPAGRIGFFMDNTAIVDSVSVRVEELCAEPGDAIIMHPWLVHAPSPNASDRPRFMLAKDIFTTTAQTRVQPAAAAVK